MHTSFKLLMILSTPFPLRPSSAIHFARQSRFQFEFFSFKIPFHGQILSVAPYSRFGSLIRASEQVHTQAIHKEAYRDTVNSCSGFNDSYSWPELSNLAEILSSKGYSQFHEDDFMIEDGDLNEKFLRDAEACLGFARARPDVLRFLTKKYVREVVENGSPFLFKNGDDSTRRMRLFLSGDESAAQTVDIIRYLLSYIYRPFLSSNGNQLKDYESVETSVRKLLLELFNFSGTVWRSKMPEPTTTQLSFGNEQLSRPPVQSIEMKRGDWICQKCTFMNFARNMNCLECGEARPKRQLTGAEWDCPQCDFFNYGRNKSCLRCDHKRPGDVLPSSAPAVGVGHTGSSSIEQQFSVSKQDSHVGSSIRSGSGPSGDTSDSISRSLDRILGRSSTPSENTSTFGDKNTSPLGKFSSSQLRQNMSNQRGKPDNVPFVPLPPDMFRKPQESNNNSRQSSEKYVSSSSNTSELIDSLLKSSENSLKNGNDKESSEASLRWSKTAAKLENAKDPANAVSDDEFPDIMPIRKGENRFVVSKKKDRSLTSPAYKRRLAAEQANNYNSVPFVPFPPGYFAKKDNQPATDSIDNSSAPLDEAETLPKRQEEQDEFDGSTANSSWPPINNSNTSTSFGGSTEKLTQLSSNSWSDNRGSWNSESVVSPKQSQNHQGTGKIPSAGYSVKSLEGSCVKELDPLDMSEEAKAERWFRRAAQIKDISELSQIPDEDFPEIMPLRKGVNRFVVSKRKTPLERRLTSPQYRRNLPIVSSEPENDAEN